MLELWTTKISRSNNLSENFQSFLLAVALSSFIIVAENGAGEVGEDCT